MDNDAWTGFFAAQVGASAPLLGLLFVGLSLNLEKVLSFASLVDRAAMGMGFLFAVFVTGSLMLVPGQPLPVLGAEVFVVGLVLLVCGTRLQLRMIRVASDRIPLTNAVIFWLAALPYTIGGALLFLGNPLGFYLVAAAVLLSLMKAVLDAWVLLVEINR